MIGKKRSPRQAAGATLYRSVLPYSGVTTTTGAWYRVAMTMRELMLAAIIEPAK